MPKKSDQRIILRAYTLRQAGLKLDDVMDRLEDEFGEEGALPDRSTISRNLRRFRAIPPEELAEDLPFTWSAMAETPWEQSRLVLDTWTYYQTLQLDQVYGPFSRRLAKWAWRVVHALGGGQGEHLLFAPTVSTEGWYQDTEELFRQPIEAPTERDVLHLALEYSWREIASVVVDETFDARDLDIWLACMPWRGQAWLERYVAISQEQGLKMKTHLGDAEWMERVWPQTARLWRGHMRDDAAGKQESASDHADRASLSRMTDGLLGSQVAHYLAARRPEPDMLKVSPEPWYFEFLDSVKERYENKIKEAKT